MASPRHLNTLRGSSWRSLSQTRSAPLPHAEGKASRHRIPSARLTGSQTSKTVCGLPRPLLAARSGRSTTTNNPQRLKHTQSPRLYTTTTTKPTPQRRLPASYYRGGTSRAPILHLSSLPPSPTLWAPLFHTILGSPDPFGRQLNGLGGGISSLSKLCLVGPATRMGADVDFTFVQMGIRDGVLDYRGSCGNMTAGVAAFAVDEGLVALPQGQEGEEGGEVVVRIHNTNTGKLIEATVPVIGGEAAAMGDFAISGVPGTGACIKLAFLDPAGSVTGTLLPTGRAVDVFEGVEVTCIDASNPCVFIAAESLGVEGTISPAEMRAHPDLLERLKAIRCQAAVKMGMCETVEGTPAGVPKISLVSPPAEEGVDIIVRAVSTGDPHGAVPISVGVSVAAAAGVEGSVVARVMRERKAGEGGEGVVVAHPSGRMVVDARFDGGRLERAVVFRTARRIMSGWVYV
ncbi:hypothetical protein VE03_08349 [Pseudogymnoascus sp. 23342-1-I1]|nr:hypothetical protein VE03_08349 [Pseudogymnoascus sp. 23342-1-I1]